MSIEELVIDRLVQSGIIEELRNDLDDVSDESFAFLMMEHVRGAEDYIKHPEFNGGYHG